MNARALRAVLATAVVAVAAGCDNGVPAPSESPPSSTAPGATPRSPSLTLTARDGRVAAAHGAGLPSDAYVELVPCAAELVGGGGPADDMCAFTSEHYALVRTAADGTFTQEVTLETFLRLGGREILCTDGGCVLGIVDTRLVATAPYVLPDGVTAPAAPVLQFAEFDVDSQTNTGRAVVTGTGFAPGAEVDLSQCPVATQGSGVDAGDCLYDYGASVLADDTGQFTADIAVYPLFQRSDGERAGEYIDCVQTPDVCVVAAPWVTNTRIAAVSFADAP